MNNEKFVRVRTGSSHILVPIEYVEEVIADPKIAKLPHVSSCIRGLINVHGQFYPVLDCGCICGKDSTNMSSKSVVLLLSNGSQQIGALVDDLVSIVADSEYTDALEQAGSNTKPQVNMRPELFTMELPIGLILDMGKLITTSNELLQTA